MTTVNSIVYPLVTMSETTKPTFTLTRKGEPFTFTSAFETLADAFRALEAQADRSDFANDLMAAARARRLSPKQAGWLHKLATDAVTPRQPKAERSTADLSSLRDMLAGSGKKFPKLRFQVGEQAIVLSLAGERSSRCGTVNITDGRPYGANTWFGRIELDGFLTAGKAATDEIVSALVTFAADPSAFAAQHGVATGCCMFCGRELETAESRSVGYGPICADRFGLPWGDTTVADEADAAAKEAARVPSPVEQAVAEIQRRAIEDKESTIQRLQDEDAESFNQRNYAAGEGRREWRRNNPHRVCHA